MTTTAGPGDRFSWDERVLRLAACIGFNAKGLYRDVSEDDETSRAPEKMGAESARMLRGSDAMRRFTRRIRRFGVCCEREDVIRCSPKLSKGYMTD